MSRNQIVAAYLQGRIDRREFVRRLTLAGVSAGAAVAYAQALTSPASAAPASRGKHGLVASFQDYPVADSDGDGLSDAEEETYGTNAFLYDTDGDGYGDGDEIDCGADALDPNSVCGDGNGGTSGGGVTPPLAFPDTGSGISTGGSGWLAPLAALGAGAAVLGSRLRRGQRQS